MTEIEHRAGIPRVALSTRLQFAANPLNEKARSKPATLSVNNSPSRIYLTSGGTGLSGAGCQPSPQTMPRVTRWIDPTCCNPLLYHQGHSFARQPLFADCAVPVHWPEQCTLVCRPGSPYVDRGNRTMPSPTERYADLSTNPFLIGLGAANVNDDPLTHRFDIRGVQTDQLGSSKAARKSDEQ
jgi:hypothetical protein